MASNFEKLKESNEIAIITDPLEIVSRFCPSMFGLEDFPDCTEYGDEDICYSCWFGEKDVCDI